MGCGRFPSPTTPLVGGSVGLPHRGVLTEGASLAKVGDGFRMLRDNGRTYGLPRFVHALERAAATVQRERPGGTLVVGDLSARGGGMILPHLSHRNGRDADLVFYATTLDGAPVATPGFVHYGADGLAWDDEGRRFLRLDVPREWRLVRALVEDPDARIQWIFVSRVVESMLLTWAQASGEPPELVARAAELMAQPQPGGVHDDHLHVRTACSRDDVLRGCEPSGPVRPWLREPGTSGDPLADDTPELVQAILAPPVETPAAPSPNAPLPVATLR